jgi:vitamin B12 transporter
MKILAAAAVILLSSTTQAQDSTKDLKGVVVTATKYPIKQSLTGKVLTVITRDELDRFPGRSLTEVLNTQSGLIVNGATGNLGTNQDVYMRGASAGKTLVLVDGVPVYDAGGISGAYELNLIPADQVERIEILKGSQSTLYGSDAMAGVINIITRKGGSKKLGANVNLAAGSFGTFKTGAGVNGTIAKTNYNVQFNSVNSKGFSSAYDQAGNKGFDKDGFDQTVFRANVNQKITDKFGLRANAQFSNYKTDLDAGAFTDDADYTVKYKNSLAGIGADYQVGKAAIHFNYNFNTLKRSYLDDSASRGGFAYWSKGDYIGRSHFVEAYSNIAVHKNVDVLVGVDYRNQQTNQTYSSVSMFGPYSSPELSDDSAKVNQLGIYASVVAKNLAGFNVELGGRYNNFNKYGDVFTFSFNPSYNINSKIKLFANISSGFKAPSLYQVYSEYRHLPESEELKPEKSLSFEGGIQYTKENVNLRAVYFIRNLTDNIVFYSQSVPPYASYYINADKQKDKGLELEAKVNFGKAELVANYTNLDGYIETSNGSKDTSFFNLYRRPRQAINLALGIQLMKNWYLSTNVQSISKTYEGRFNNTPVEIPSYYTWNLYTQYSIGKFAKLFVDLKNITDEKYSETYGYNSRRFNVMAGINLQL